MLQERFGMLRVVARHGTTQHRKALWRCYCDCGGETFATTNNLRSGNSKSCGCEKRMAWVRARTSHGHMRGYKMSRAYSAWANMKTRCLNTDNEHYARWGGRGIKVCDRWLTFENFLADMGDPPEGLSLDRKDNDGHYEPSNCRWADAYAQVSNRRPMKSERFIAFNGQTLNLSDWARELGFERSAILARLKRGWDEVAAVTTPRLVGRPRSNTKD